MRIVTAIVLLVVSTAMLPNAARAQLYAAGPVVNGHHHLNVTDVAAHTRFWVDTLGGKAGTFATGTPIVLFPNALIFMREQST
ncbi:MAG TPA: hypothetical protein VKQ06_03690, partial [Gammaproteobacteria bacterium]|nr:hypothetical protein [Gammaproteobacteria bacterium]